MKKLYFFISVINIALAMAGWLFFESAISGRSQTSTNEDDLHKAYDRGIISRGEAMALETIRNNERIQNLYGRVIDQDGKPVAGVDVTGEVEIMNGFIVGKLEDYKTQTDAEGLFQFTGLKGASLSATVSKPGYEIDYRVGRIGPAGGQSSPDDRMIFLVWKLRGAEPMVHSEFESRVPYDGTSATFILTNGKTDTNGDLQITLLRSQLKIHRGQDKYDWTVKIKMVKGGLFAENDPYPNWAPANGYQSAFEASMSSNTIPWSPELIRNFYITNSQGHYGRLFIDLSTDSMRPDTGITVKTWINPSGSQNLEFDPNKQIRR